MQNEGKDITIISTSYVVFEEYKFQNFFSILERVVCQRRKEYCFFQNFLKLVHGGMIEKVIQLFFLFEISIYLS